jgi:hypothetical protein
VGRAVVVCALPFLVMGCGLEVSGLLDSPSPDAGGDGPGTGADAFSGFDASGTGSSSGGGDAKAPQGDGSKEAAAPGDGSAIDSSRADTSPVDSGADTSSPPDVATEVPAVSYPATCSAADAGPMQTVTLYVGGDPGKPWTAVCNGTATYLPLAGAANTSSYPVGSCATVGGGAAGGVFTSWSMLRIDPATLLVDTSDFTGAVSTGDTYEVSGNGTYKHDYVVMPFAATRSCLDQMPASPGAGVDLTGTHFAIASSQVWHAQGWSNHNGGQSALRRCEPRVRAERERVGRRIPGGHLAVRRLLPGHRRRLPAAGLRPLSAG